MAFFGLFAILPTFKTIAGLKREIEDGEVVNLKLQNKIKSLSKAEDLYLEASNNISLMNQVLPEKAEFERIAWQIEWLALNKGVEIANGNYNEFSLVDTIGKVPEIQSMEIELTVNGSYPKIAEFISSITKIDRLISIRGVTISSKKLRQGGVISANIKLMAYYLPYVK